ncbi:MAG: BsuPI-related putative proteinase inhibitor [bacterium]|nr:BsuPI-related putative proteinase inhibitor [bacterium]
MMNNFSRTKIRKIFRFRKFYWILLIIGGLLIMILSGCPQSGNGQPQNDNNRNGNDIIASGASDESGSQGDFENETVSESGSETESGSTDKEEDNNSQILHGPVTGYQPTQDEPFAPGAPDASGVENVPPGQLALVASLSGTGDMVPLIDSAEVTAGDSVLVQCSIVNNTDAVVEFSYITSQKFDIFVTDRNGEQVYKWSQNTRFAQVLGDQFVEAGDVWSHELTIPIGENGISPGTYGIEVVLTGLPELRVSASNVIIIASE